MAADRPPASDHRDGSPLTKSMTSLTSSEPFAKNTLVDGRPARVRCVQVNGQEFRLGGGLMTTMSLEDEWFEEVQDPELVIEWLRRDAPVSVDLFSFCQRLPNVEPRFAYGHEFESIAALPVQSYQHWFDKQIESATRNKIRKSARAGVEVRECSYDDDFIRGMVDIFNETPVRQGRPFWHYGKDFETVKSQFSRCLFREELLGAFYRDELIGFVMLGKAASFADLGQIISKVAHRDKAPTNALIAKAVEVCAARGIPNLVYAFWTDDSLGEFKRQSGFREVRLPRYIVPLTAKGRLAVSTGIHRGVKSLLPPQAKAWLKQARNAWYERRAQRGPTR